MNITKCNIWAFLLTFGSVVSAVAQSDSLPKLGKDSVDQVVAAMTLHEKASIVVGGEVRPGSGTGPVVGVTKDLVRGAAGTTTGVERLGISRMCLADGPAGLRINARRPDDENTYYCTAFPIGSLLASTWDTELVHKVGETMGNEVLEYGADIILAPGMNIQRNPLCGRNFEYYSEDPFISGKIAAAMVNGVESQGVGTSIKHFAANNAETRRDTLDTFINERAMREIYLEGFRIAVQESQPWTVMSSYNKINGTYTSERYDLLTEVLRTDWGFQGIVMTDWFGGIDPVAQMKAGNDLLMPGSRRQISAIEEAVTDGRLDIKVLDTNVKRILATTTQSPRFKGYKFSNKPDLPAHAKVARQSAAEGMVLLKNDGCLPLAVDVKKIAILGSTSNWTISGGAGSGAVSKAYSVNIFAGLKNAGYIPNETLEAFYVEMQKPSAEPAVDDGLLDEAAKVSDAAVITIGRNSSESRDWSKDEGGFKLTVAEYELVKRVTTAFHAQNKEVVVILNIGGVIETASWKAMPDAILLAWQGGQEVGNSVADILCGKVNPSGKLAITFPVRYEDVPSAATFPCKELTGGEVVDPVTKWVKKRAEVTYHDGIYVGYRYYETFKVQPSYEFGYGLSYTTFAYSGIKVSSPIFADKMMVTVEVKNAGQRAGKEVVELYLTAPAKKLDKPAIELKGFAKTRLLQPGESQVLTFTLDARSLASFDPTVSSWIADQGAYTVKIGASSKDIRQQVTFTLNKEVTVKKESVALVPKTKIQEIRPSL